MPKYPQKTQIAGFEVTKLGGSDYEIANPQQKLDFYLQVRRSGKVFVIMFDSEIETIDTNDPYLHDFVCESLEEAITDAMGWKRPNQIQQEETNVT